jgi:hypothetical protein
MAVEWRTLVGTPDGNLLKKLVAGARNQLYRPSSTWSPPDFNSTSSAILYLRQHYHLGPARIAAYLHRFHELESAGSYAEGPPRARI